MPTRNSSLFGYVFQLLACGGIAEFGANVRRWHTVARLFCGSDCVFRLELNTQQKKQSQLLV